MTAKQEREEAVSLIGKISDQDIGTVLRILRIYITNEDAGVSEPACGAKPKLDYLSYTIPTERGDSADEYIRSFREDRKF